VTFLDTAGIDDESEIGSLRVSRTREALDSSDIAVLVCDASAWTEYEDGLVSACADQKTPLIIVINKIDLHIPDAAFLDSLAGKAEHIITLSCQNAFSDRNAREDLMLALKKALIACAPESFFEPPAILGDLLPSGSSLPIVVLIVPIDLQAPKGRLILPQVQSIRDALDSDAACIVVKEREYPALLASLARPPDLVVCDSQVALKMVADTPDGIPCTTFSILFSRFKGNIELMARGAAVLSNLKDGDRILISEACTHHALEDDIGRVKIPRWIRQYSGLALDIDHAAGRDYPADLSLYSLVIHCGACTLTRREMLLRIELARRVGIPVTNYGMAISALQGVIERTLSPFPAALDAYREALH